MTTRRNIMLGTAGHVDHGKTALVKLLTGCDTDTLTEEKQRGLTIDLGFAPCRLSDQRVVGVVDVPGHVDFIRNMVAGAHGIDVVIFVVAADDGVMPQTHEHLHILTLMGLRHGLIALTKRDLVDNQRCAAVVTELRRLTAGTFLAHAPVCPVSNVTGEGFDRFFDTLNEVVKGCDDHSTHGSFRLWIEDVFTVRGAGTVVTGIPVQGRVRPGMVLQLLPPRIQGRVRRLQAYGEDATEGRAGECLALNLPEFEHETVRRGMVLCEENPPEPVTRCEGELRILETLAAPWKDGMEAHLHVGTASVLTQVAMLEARQMVPGATGMIQLHLAEPIAVVAGDRFVLRANVTTLGRSGLATIGGGRILDTTDVRLRRQRPWIISRLTARRDALDHPHRWAEQILRESQMPVRPADMQRHCLLRAEETLDLLAQLRSAGRCLATSGGGVVHSDNVAIRANRILDAVESFHRAHADQAGMPRQALAAATGKDDELNLMALESLVQGGRVRSNGVVVALAGWKPHVSDPARELNEHIAAAFQKAGWAPPAPEEIVLKPGLSREGVHRSIRWLLELGVLVRLDDRVVMHRDAIEAGQRAALQLFQQQAAFTTMQFRDALGVSRKFAVPLLDHLDRTRFTVRSGHDRTPGVEARKRLPGRA
jgi:selenocysteine-specific elongation factor